MSWLPYLNPLIYNPSNFWSFRFVLLLEYANLDIPLGHNFKKDAVHNAIFT